jgi:hypothetical protein
MDMVARLAPLGKYRQYAFLLSAWAENGIDKAAIAEMTATEINFTIFELY